MKYRSDIDGLRAIAILSVLIYHMFPSVLTGGFAGVDIFFIISGYLIGSTIFKEYETGKFSFLQFYKRRFIRIIPLLLIVVISSFLMGYFLLLPFEFRSLGRHVGAATTFISNFLLLKEVDYFAAAAELKPLLHLWSLAIEEQFYLILPLIIVLSGKNNRSIKVIAALILISFSYCLYLAKVNPEAGFFRAEARFWELLLGVLLSKIEKNKLFDFQGRIHLSLIGIICCFLGVYFFGHDLIYPSYYAILPCLGAILIILGGADSYINKHFLSNVFVVFIGKISYSLYLWHWVLLSYNNIFYQQNPPVYMIYACALLAIILSIITFYAVEKPLKKLTPTQQKVVLAISLISLVATHIAGRSAYKGKITQHNLDAQILLITNAEIDYKTIRDLMSDNALEAIAFHGETLYKIGNGKRKIAFIGDSHTEQYISLIKKRIDESDNQFSAYFVLRPFCIVINDVQYVDYRKKHCSDYYREALKFFKDEGVEKVVYSSHLVNALKGRTDAYYIIDGKESKIKEGEKTYEYALKNLEEGMRYLTDNGIQTYLVSMIPYGDEFVPMRMIKRELDGFKVSLKVDAPDFDLSKFNEENGRVMSDIKRVALNANAQVIDPIDFLCRDGKCSVRDEEGRPIYRDSNHFTKSYSTTKIKYFDFLFQ